MCFSGNAFLGKRALIVSVSREFSKHVFLAKRVILLVFRPRVPGRNGGGKNDFAGARNVFLTKNEKTFFTSWAKMFLVGAKKFRGDMGCRLTNSPGFPVLFALIIFFFHLKAYLDSKIPYGKLKRI